MFPPPTLPPSDRTQVYWVEHRLAYRSGVTAAIVSPTANGEFGGLSTAFFTGAAHKLEKHAVLAKVTALHVNIGHLGRRPSVSTQIAALRKALSGGFEGDRGEWYKQAAEVRLHSS